MKTLLTILIALTFVSCKKEYQCTLETEHNWAFVDGRRMSGSNTYQTTFTGSRKEMLQFEKDRSYILKSGDDGNSAGLKIYVMRCH